MKMKPKQLKSILQDLDGFISPIVQLEQYSTPPEIAVEVLQYIDEEVGFDGNVVADVGCGTGCLSLIGASFLGASLSVGIDCDTNALSIAKGNITKNDLQTVTQLMLADVREKLPLCSEKFDIVITNPPFGTKNNKGTDVDFVLTSLEILRCGGKLYSLHKKATRDYLLRKAAKWTNIHAECVAELKWNLSPTYKFHKKKNVDVDIDLMCFEKC